MKARSLYNPLVTWLLRSPLHTVMIVRNAALWMPANAVAWAFGMVIIFLAIDIALDSGSATSAVSDLAVTLTLAGATVGAVRGAALVWLLRPT